MTSLKKKSITGFVWDFVGKIGLQGVGFFVSIILARILAPEDFGILAIIMVLINLANVFQDFGFGTALVQRAEVTEEHYSSVFFMNLVMGLLLATIMFFLAPFIADFYDKSVLTNLIRVMSVCFIINAFGNVTRAHLRREMNFKLMSYTTIASAIISGFIAVYMAYNGYGVWCLIFQLIVGQLLSNIFLYLGCKIHFALHFSFKAIKELWGFSSKFFFAGLLDTIFLNIDPLIIGKTSSPATLGYYYRAKSFEELALKYTSGSLTSVLFSALNKIQKDKEAIKIAMTKLFNIVSILSFFVCGLLFIISKDLFIFLFTSKWTPAIIIFQLLIISAFANQIQSIFVALILSQGKSNYYLKINIFSKILRGLSLLFLFFYGLNSFLYFNIASNLILLFIYIHFTIKCVGLNLRFIYIDLAKYILVYIVTIIISYFIYLNYHSIDSLVNLLLFTPIYSFLFLISLMIFNKKGFSIITVEINSLIKLYK